MRTFPLSSSAKRTELKKKPSTTTFLWAKESAFSSLLCCKREREREREAAMLLRPARVSRVSLGRARALVLLLHRARVARVVPLVAPLSVPIKNGVLGGDSGSCKVLIVFLNVACS